MYGMRCRGCAQGVELYEICLSPVHKRGPPLEAGVSTHHGWMVLEPATTLGLHLFQLIQRVEPPIGQRLVGEGPKPLSRRELGRIRRCSQAGRLLRVAISPPGSATACANESVPRRPACDDTAHEALALSCPFAVLLFLPSFHYTLLKQISYERP